MAQFKYIKLTRGYRAKVSLEDFDFLSQFKWQYYKNHKDKYGYARTSTPPFRGKKMHRIILNAKQGEIVDHINFNGIDNRRENIRIVDASTSMHHRRHKNKLGYRGVNKVNKGGYTAIITLRKKRIYLGYFKTAREAAKAYVIARKKLYGL